MAFRLPSPRWVAVLLLGGILGAGAATPAPAPKAAFPAVCVAWDDASPSVGKLSLSRAKSVQRWLEQTGVASRLVPDSGLAAALVGGCRVVHLVMLETERPARDKALRTFVQGGGRLVAWGCSSAGLAAFYGVKREADVFLRPKKDDVWRGFRFVGERASGVPDAIATRAGGVCRTVATTPETRLCARWYDGKGERSAPAAFENDKGYWIVRVLYDDASPEARKDLVFSLTARWLPMLGADAVARLESLLWVPFGVRDWTEAKRVILCKATGARRIAAQAEVEMINGLLVRKDALVREGKVEEARATLTEIQRRVAVAYAAAHPIPVNGKPFRVCVWDPSGRGPDGVGGWKLLAPKLAAAGVTDVFLFAGSPAGTSLPVAGLSLLPPSQGAGDPFPEAIATCHRYGIRVHAWFCLFRFENAEEATAAKFKEEGRLLKNVKGEVLPWLDPRAAANVTLLRTALADLVRKTGVDGVSLDFVRYPDGAVAGGKDEQEVRKVLSSVREAIRGVSPSCEVSVSVYGKYPSCRDSVGQDWRRWLADGLVDVAVPMLYVPTVEDLRTNARTQKRFRDRQLCGIGYSSKEAFLSTENCLDQIAEARRLGYAGVGIYFLDPRFLDDLAPALRVGLGVR